MTNARWISDKNYRWPRRASPTPFVFCKTFCLRGTIRHAVIECTALGIYELEIDGRKVGEDYFRPGFTSYLHQIQVQRYDVTEMLSSHSVLTATVAGGWAVGEFNYNRKSRIAADRPALRLEMQIEYADGSTETVCTDESWQVTQDGPVRAASFYDGEVYDATVVPENAAWISADLVRPRGRPKLLPEYGPPVRVWRELYPVKHFKAASGETIYDFGQNFTGVISFQVKGHRGQELVFRHAELLNGGELYTAPLRTAKAEIHYTCREGDQSYSPRFTYMGFRYVGMRGIEPEKITIKALALSSELKEVGSFQCSDERINRLNENIRWSARSNFVDIPTDCPQRDERLGWTGDIALFASTACFHYDMSAFFEKWLMDLRSEQSRLGGFPMVIPRNGHEWPAFTTACWGDSCILVPWAEYMARGDIELLRRSYQSIQKFLRSVKRWARLFSFGKRRYIWKLLFQYGDWCAPQDPPEPWPKCVRTWMKKGPWIATAYWANSCAIAAQMAELLEKPEDARFYRSLREKICRAYREVFTDGKGRLHEEFQTGYVLPLWFGMTAGSETSRMAANLDALVEKAGNRLTTGFPGTPYLLFALSDHGYADRAYKLLLQEKMPSWLYEANMGATTVWERWDAVSPDGSFGQNAMCSCNHYAYGAVGDWLYRRVLGIEATSGGYKTFRIAPVPGGSLTWARGHHDTPYGRVVSDWVIKNGIFEIHAEIPPGTACLLKMPSGKEMELVSGSYTYNEPIGKDRA